tara:strand:- start:20801 stop:22027 length:1227 start_codon:yes stop_codon:yes gene_type:complete
MPLRIIKEDRKEREDEQRRRKAGRRKMPGTQTARKPKKPPTPSPGPGSLMNKPKKPIVLISLGNYDKARKEVEAEGGSPRLKTEDDRTSRSLNKVYGNVRGKKDEFAFLSGGQAKLDKNKNNKIDAQDFKILRAEKAKGRGQGLQDEKMKPGKVMKAKEGKLGEAKDYKNYLKGLKEATKSKSAQRAGEIAKKAAKSTTIGKIALGVAGAGIAAKKFIESDKFKDMLKKKMNKKMGGGMMKRPMGYSKGMSSKDDNLRDIRKTESMIGASKSSKREQAIKNRMGGADMSKKPTSKMKASETVRTYALAQSMKNKDRLTERDIATAKKAVSKKMGGGMMNRPMGYKKGKLIPSKKSFDKVLGVFPLIKPKKKMGGGMMQRPMGMARYKKGTMIKARGGGIARSKPTKMY